MAAAERPAHLVFSGSMDWHPNEDAVIYFADAILPRIRAADSRDARSRSSGATRPRVCASSRRAAGDHRHRHGRATCARRLREGAVYVVPLRAGGGTRLKIFEALAMARPVVSTTVGAEGLGIEPGRHFVAADDPRDVCRRGGRRCCAIRSGGAQLGTRRAPSRRGLLLVADDRAALSNNIVKRWLPRMRMHAEAPTVVLICHEQERLDREGLASWLASTLRLAGLIIIRDEPGGAGAPRGARSGASGLLGFARRRRLPRVRARCACARATRRGKTRAGRATARTLSRRSRARCRTLTVSSPNSRRGAGVPRARCSRTSSSRAAR